MSPKFILGRNVLGKKINIGVYLDFDNIWGGLLRELGIDPDERRRKGIGLLSEEISLLKKILNEILPLAFYEGIARRFTSVSHRNYSAQVRYVKAFAVFSKLPFGDQIGDIQTILHNSGIEPFPSFIAKDTKDASDRSLILEIVEDIFFNHLPIDIVVIGSGDVDFYPLVSFFYEHSDKSLYILSFENSKSSLYEEIPLTSSKLICLEKLKIEVETDFGITVQKDLNWILGEEKRILLEKLYEKFSKFKEIFFRDFKAYEEKGKEVKSGLVVKRWRKQWKEKEQITFTENEINYFRSASK